MGAPVDACALIHLAKAEALAVTASAFGALIAPPSVWREAVEAGTQRSDPEVPAILMAEARGWIRRQALDARQRKRAADLADRHGLGAGEAEVLAIGPGHPLVLSDEVRGRRRAESLGIVAIPTLLVPLLCADRDVLDEAAAITLLGALARHCNARFEEVTQVERDIRRLFP